MKTDFFMRDFFFWDKWLLLNASLQTKVFDDQVDIQLPFTELRQHAKNCPHQMFLFHQEYAMRIFHSIWPMSMPLAGSLSCQTPHSERWERQSLSPSHLGSKSGLFPSQKGEFDKIPGFFFFTLVFSFASSVNWISHPLLHSLTYVAKPWENNEGFLCTMCKQYLYGLCLFVRPQREKGYMREECFYQAMFEIHLGYILTHTHTNTCTHAHTHAYTYIRMHT